MVQPQNTHRAPQRPVLEAYVNLTAANYTAKAGDRVIGVNHAGIVTITLPTAEVRKGRIYTVKDESGSAASNNITVATEGSETIGGSATDVINLNYESKSYYSDGTNWFILPVTPDTKPLALATTVSTQAHGDSAAGGSATTASKGDHNHAMPAAAGPSQATQAALEAETNENTYAPPDLIKHSPGVAKVWLLWEQAGTHSIRGSYNMTSVTDGGAVGDTDLLWNVDFSCANYSIVGAAQIGNIMGYTAGTVETRPAYSIGSPFSLRSKAGSSTICSAYTKEAPRTIARRLENARPHGPTGPMNFIRTCAKLSRNSSIGVSWAQSRNRAAST